MFRQSLTLFAALLLTACGGGSGGGIFANTHETQRSAIDGRSGYVSTVGGVFKTSSGFTVRVGDYSNNVYASGFYSFDLAGINTDATVTQALLVVGQESEGGNAYDDLGGIVTVDHMNLGAALDAADDNLANHITLAIGTLSNNYDLEQKVVDVTAAVQADLDALRSRSEFRLRFPVGFSNDGQADYVRFNNPSDSGGSGFTPTLIVKYED